MGPRGSGALGSNYLFVFNAQLYVFSALYVLHPARVHPSHEMPRRVVTIFYVVSSPQLNKAFGAFVRKIDPRGFGARTSNVLIVSNEKL